MIKDIVDIEKVIDWDAVNSKYWKDESDLDRKRRKHLLLSYLNTGKQKLLDRRDLKIGLT